MTNRRVVVTGMGVVSPLGLNANHVWQQLIEGKNGITNITSFDASGLPSQVAGEIPLGNYSEYKFNAEEWMPAREIRRNDKFIVYTMAATEQAVQDSNLLSLSEEQLAKVGVNIGSGIGGISTTYQNSILIAQGDYRKMSPFFIPSALINLAPGLVSIKYGFKGSNISIVTACATGAHCIGEAFLAVKNHGTDIMVAGGAEAAICPLGVAGFSRMSALSTKFNDNPAKASRPWDKDRDGFVISEGAAILVLEELEHAKKRGATIYGEIVGYGTSSDASHITTPSGEGAISCMQNALNNAKLSSDEINYINAHGTSTPLGDEAEAKAITTVFKNTADGLKVSSTKSATGHLLGATGAFEAMVAIQACRHNIIPPTLNLDNPIDGFTLDFVPNQSKEANVNYALTNSFGFGGTNAALIVKKANF